MLSAMRVPESISSPANPALGEFRRAASGRPEGAVLVEGVRLCREVAASGRVRAALWSDALLARPGGPELRDRLLGLPGLVRLLEAPERLIARVSPVEACQGVLLLVERPSWRLEALLQGRPFLALLCGLQDPGNVGALVRSAEAAGATGVLVLPGSADPLGPKALRAGAGSALRLPWARLSGPEEAVQRLAAAGIALYASDAARGVDYRKVVYEAPLAFALGAEAAGVPAAILEAARSSVRIPMAGRVESLNVAVAGSLLLFEAARGSECLR